jgi:hypothetical protein
MLLRRRRTNAPRAAPGDRLAYRRLALRRVPRFNARMPDNSERIDRMSHPVDDDPVMASAIGRCSNQWTHAEVQLTWIFSSLTNTDTAVAVTVFSFFKATRTQRDVLKKLAKMTPFMTEPLRERLTKSLKTYCALAEGRNELLHNPIGRSMENEVYIMLRSKAPTHGEIPYQSKPISPSEIDALSTEIKTLNLELRDLSDAITKARFSLLDAST